MDGREVIVARNSQPLSLGTCQWVQSMGQYQNCPHECDNCRGAGRGTDPTRTRNMRERLELKMADAAMWFIQSLRLEKTTKIKLQPSTDYHRAH